MFLVQTMRESRWVLKLPIFNNYHDVKIFIHIKIGANGIAKGMQYTQ